MHIAVTGAAGRIGRYIVRDLLAAGHSVQGIDAVAGSGLQVDLTDAGQVYGALAGADAVVHMGAWANAFFRRAQTWVCGASYRLPATRFTVFFLHLLSMRR